MINFFMTMAGICYVGASLSYIIEGQPWMGSTMLLYAFSIATIYMAGSH